jgi:predicted nucleic acid-binding protein
MDNLNIQGRKSLTDFFGKKLGADLELTRSAAQLRAEHKLPYADCFAAAVAVNRKASLATCDKDFAQVEKKLEILWTIGV